MGLIWIWRWVAKAAKLLSFRDKHSGGSGGGGKSRSSVLDTLPDVVGTALGWLF